MATMQQQQQQQHAGEGAGDGAGAGAGVGSTTNLSARLAGVLAVDLDSPSLAAALGAYSDTAGATAGTNAAGERGSVLPLADSLRSSLEQEGIKALDAFLAAHAPLGAALSGLETQIGELSRRVRGTQQAYGAAVGATARVAESAQVLYGRAEETQDKAAVVGAFLAKFQLTSEEVAALEASALSPEFFDALERVQGIHGRCKEELKTQSQVAGLEIMEEMGRYENVAYERLYRWVQSEGRSLDKDVAEIPELLRKAVMALKLRPELFRCCLQEVASARHNAVVRGFLDAITRGGPSGMPRPIEVHAHDPLRYIGDMLAWLHQAVAWEKELVSVLFEGTEVEDDGAAVSGGESEILDSPQALLSHIFQGVCRTLQVRFEQSLSLLGGGVGEDSGGRGGRELPRSLSTLFSLSNLLQFYGVTLGRILGEYAPLIECIGVCSGRAEAKFQAQLKNLAEALLRRPPSVPSDLRAPGVLEATLSQLSEVMLTFSGSLVPEEERELQFAPILELVLHPLIKACTLSAVALDPGDMAVYMLNCLGSMHGRLCEYAEFTGPAIEQVGGQVAAHMDTLVQEQARSILSDCGVLGKLAVTESHDASSGPLAQVAGMSGPEMAGVMRSFDAMLSASSVILMPETDKLVSAETRQTARSRVAEFISDAYTRLYTAVCEPANGYGNPSTILLHSPDELKVLLR